MAELIDIADRVIGWASADEQVEVFVVHERETEVRAYEQQVESLMVAESQGVGIRVVRDGRQGFAHAGTLDLDVLAADHCRQLWLRELHDSKRTPLRDDQPRDRRRIGVNRRKRGRTAPAASQDRHECQDGAKN